MNYVSLLRNVGPVIVGAGVYVKTKRYPVGIGAHVGAMVGNAINNSVNAAESNEHPLKLALETVAWQAAGAAAVGFAVYLLTE